MEGLDNRQILNGGLTSFLSLLVNLGKRFSFVSSGLGFSGREGRGVIMG